MWGVFVGFCGAPALRYGLWPTQGGLRGVPTLEWATEECSLRVGYCGLGFLVIPSLVLPE